MVLTPHRRESFIAWLEKQGERPINKVEPKFKDGDWIVYKDTVWKVCNISLLNYYELLKINNEVSTRLIEDVDSNAHLWTIQDAKDGDVLAVEPIEGYYLPFIAIYKEGGFDFFNSHCFIGFDGIFYNGDTGHSIDNIHPATKEQCDLLFQKMKEAGYEWDAEKKELKKIEHPECSKDNLSDFESYLCLMFQKFRTKGICTNGEIVDFVEEHVQKLKDTLCPTWSEEDKAILEKCIGAVKASCYSPSFKLEAENWLKSLGPKKQWKPSDKQMKVLSTVINLNNICASEKAELRKLFEQLKQL